MNSAKSASLLRLQEALSSSSERGRMEVAGRILPYDVGSERFGITCTNISRLVMPADVIRLEGYSHLPSCVIGAVVNDNEMLSVVDAGLLMGRMRIVPSVKARLVVFDSGPLKGIALHVDRVHDRIDERDALGVTITNEAGLLTMLQSFQTRSSVA